MRLGGAGSEGGDRTLDTLPLEIVRDGVVRRNAQPDQPATGTDGRQQILRRRRAEQPHSPRGGSSIALSSALSACSVNRSASSTIVTCQRPRIGASAERVTSWRVSPTP